MVFCGRCGAPNPDENQYCNSCGSSIRLGEPIPGKKEEEKQSTKNNPISLPSFSSFKVTRNVVVVSAIITAVAMFLCMFLITIPVNKVAIGFDYQRTMDVGLLGLLTSGMSPLAYIAFIGCMTTIIVTMVWPILSTICIPSTVLSYAAAACGGWKTEGDSVYGYIVNIDGAIIAMIITLIIVTVFSIITTILYQNHMNGRESSMKAFWRS